MEVAVLIALLTAAWVLIGPLFGILAMRKAGRLERELATLRQTGVPSGALGPVRRATAEQMAPLAQQKPPPAKATAQATRAGAESALAPSDRPDPKPRPPSPSLEKRIAGGWMVWAGGLALALGGLFLVRVAIEAGWFGPFARTAAGGVFGLGLVAIAFRAAHMPIIKEAKNALRFLPHILSGAGLVSLYGATLAAGALYGFVSPFIALVMFSAVSLAGLVLALRFGPVLAGLALTGAYLAPIFTGADGGSALMILPYAASITALGLGLIRMKSWRFVSWIALAGTGFWALAAMGSPSETAEIWAIPAYALSTGGFALWLASFIAHMPVLLPSRVSSLAWLLRQRGEAVLIAHLFWALTGVLLLLSAFDWPANLSAASAVALYAGIGLFAAWRRDGLALLAPGSAVVCLIGLALWPSDLPNLWAGAAASGIGFGVFAMLAQTGKTVRAPLAVTSAIVPPAALAIAFWRGGLEPSFLLGLCALLLAVCAGWWLDRRRNTEGGLDAHPGAAAAYAIGLALSAALAPFLMLEDFWLGPALAVVAATIACVHRRFPLVSVRGAAMAAAAGATALMLRPGLLKSLEVVGPPLANTLALAGLLAVSALVAGSVALRPAGNARNAFEGAALLTFFGSVGLVIRHGAGADSVFESQVTLAEASGHAIAYFGSAVALSWRGIGRGWVWRIGETIALAIGGFAVLAAVVRVDVDPVGTWPFVNLLLPALAIPALFLAAQGEAHRRSGRRQIATLQSSIAIALGGLWLLLETRRTFVQDALWTSPIGQSEMWALSIVAIVYSFMLLIWGVWRGRTLARYGSLIILLGAVAKVFLIDLGATDGVIRALSFIGLGGALIGVALFYQRFVFKEGSPRLDPRV
ncbi:MAG: DUF2339 domain-containing protein [Pseudomonadota bacterium]